MESTFTTDEICRIARNQRNILFAILVNLLSLALLFFGLSPDVISIISLVAFIIMAVCFVKLRNAMKKDVFLTVIGTICLLLHVLSLIILAVNNSSATKILRDAGLYVGFWGVSEADLQKYAAASNTTPE